MAIDGRKYGRGKYGAGTYDLGVAHGIPPWVPISPPVDVWAPIAEPPAWCDIPAYSLDGPEIWTPILVPHQEGNN